MQVHILAECQMVCWNVSAPFSRQLPTSQQTESCKLSLVRWAVQVAQETAVGPPSTSEDGSLAAGLKARQVPGAESSRGDWASWKSGQASGQVRLALTCGDRPVFLHYV